MRQLLTGTLTLLFTDIEGSTRLLQQLGDRYAAVLKECRRLLRVAFQHENGLEVDTQGDAFFVVFENATEAIGAAVKAQKALFAAHWPEDAKVRVRIGLHTGEPQPTDEGYIGLDVHCAARIMSAAHGGQVLLSQKTRDFVVTELPDDVRLRDLGTYRLKDIAGMTHLYQLVIPGLPTEFSSPTALSSKHILHSIPAPSTSFVGREQEMATIGDLMLRSDVRLLTLLGPGGVGKTRLAVQLAERLKHRFANGICFIPLDLASNDSAVLAAIAGALNIQEELSRPLLEQIKIVLHDLSILLILDNFEQVMTARSIIADLLLACPQLKVLVTSRVMLHLRAEHLFDVPSLPLPDQKLLSHLEYLPDMTKLFDYAAIALFVQRAQAVQPTFQLSTVNAASVVAICVRLDGIPLAIELAAARIRHFQPQVLLTYLERSLFILQRKADDVPARQQTLESTIAWSYNLLTATEQQIFRRFAVFVNGASLEAAEKVCIGLVGSTVTVPAASADSPDSTVQEVLSVLDALIDQSMLQRQELGKQGVRFWQLQTLREYGLLSLAEAGELEPTQAAHAAYFLDWIGTVVPLIAGAEQADWLDRLDRDYENVRLALEWLIERARVEQGRNEQALQMCNALFGYWESRGYFKEGLTLVERTLAVSQGKAATERAQALHGAAFLAMILDDSTKVEAFLRESQALFRASGDKASMANILRLQGNLSITKSNYKLARRLLEEALKLYDERGDTRRIIATREALAQIAITQCHYSRAKQLLQENITSYQARGDRYRLPLTLFFLAQALFLSHEDLNAARSLAEESLTLFRTVGNKRLMAYNQNLLGQILYMETQNYNDATVLLEESLAIFKVMEERSGIADTLMALAYLAVSQGRYEAARAYYTESWQLLHVIGAKDLCAACIEGFGEVLVSMDDPRRAVHLWGTAATVRATIMAPIPPIYRISYNQAVAGAREKLGDEAFQEAWAEGHRTPLEQVVIS